MNATREVGRVRGNVAAEVGGFEVGVDVEREDAVGGRGVELEVLEGLNIPPPTPGGMEAGAGVARAAAGVGVGATGATELDLRIDRGPDSFAGAPFKDLVEIVCINESSPALFTAVVGGTKRWVDAEVDASGVASDTMSIGTRLRFGGAAEDGDEEEGSVGSEAIVIGTRRRVGSV